MSTLTEEQLYLLAMSALLTESNDQHHDVLYGEHDDSYGKKLGINTLKKFWDISDRESLMDTINWLYSEGHRVPFLNDLADGTITDPEEWTDNIDAWDFCRIMSLARWGAAAGYISDDEAWNQLKMCGSFLEQRYSSFEDIANHYLNGYEYWFDEAPNESFVAAYDYLTDPENNESPWNLIKWGYYSR